MMKEKAERVKVLLNDIEQKIMRIDSINRALVDFNTKMKVLLMALEESSVSFSQDVQAKSLSREEAVGRTDEGHSTTLAETQIAVERVPPSAKAPIADDTQYSSADQIQGIGEVIEEVYKIIPPNLFYRENARKLLCFLSKDHNGILYEDILRGSRVPKYRCVDLLNILMKANPPFVTKTNCNGKVYYRLNEDCFNR